MLHLDEREGQAMIQRHDVFHSPSFSLPRALYFIPAVIFLSQPARKITERAKRLWEALPPHFLQLHMM